MKTLATLTALLALAACSGGPAATLPDGCYGQWELMLVSGGIGGVEEEPGEDERVRMTIARDGTIETRTADGKVTKESFTLRMGRTIFTGEDGLLMKVGESDMESVVRLAPDGGTLTLSENVQDCFVYTWRRVGK